MSHLKTKSDLNLDAAQLLIDKSLYAPSVHCAYYGCFQFIKSKLNAIGYTYLKIDEDIASNPKLHSHKYPIKLIVDQIRIQSVNDKTLYSTINNKIKLLKTAREESDYFNEIVDSDAGDFALKTSKEIIDEVKKLKKIA